MCGAIVSVTVGVMALVLVPASTLGAMGGAPAVFGLGFVLGVAVVGCALELVNACVTTLFVCLAEDPQALASSKPELYSRIASAVSAMYEHVDIAEQQDVERQYGSVTRR